MLYILIKALLKLSGSFDTFCFGEAAGTAVAKAHKKNSDVRDVDIKELQTTLKSNNAYIGV